MDQAIRQIDRYLAELILADEKNNQIYFGGFLVKGISGGICFSRWLNEIV